MAHHEPSLEEVGKRAAELIGDLQKYLRDERRDKNISNLNKALKEFCMSDLATFKAVANLDDVKEMDIGNVDEILDATIAKCMRNVDYSSHAVWKKLEQIHPNIIATDERDQSIVLTLHTISDMDPISKKKIENGCKSKICGHVYESKTIMEHIQKQQKRNKVAKCPYMGCEKNVAKEDLQVVDCQSNNEAGPSS